LDENCRGDPVLDVEFFVQSDIRSYAGWSSSAKFGSNTAPSFPNSYRI